MTPRFWRRLRCVLRALAGWTAFVAVMAEMARGPAARPQLHVVGGAR